MANYFKTEEERKLLDSHDPEWRERPYRYGTKNPSDISNSYTMELLRLQKTVHDPYFRCPSCDALYDKNVSVSLPVIAGKDLINEYSSGNLKTKEYLVTSFNVRFCPKCFHRKKRIEEILIKILRILDLIIMLPLLGGIIYICFTEKSDGELKTFLGFLFMILMVVAAAWYIYEEIPKFVREKFINVADIHLAYKNNAIG